jgi:hypothetical protein
MPTTEVDQWIDRNSPKAAVEAFARAIDLESTIDDSETNPAVLDIMASILTAEDNEDAIFAAANAGAISGKDFANKPFLLKSADIQWKRSGAVYRDQGGFPWYALMHITDLETGEERVMTCGGLSIVTTIWKLQRAGILDKYEDGMPLVFTEKATGSGFNTLLLNKYIMPKAHARTGKGEKA